LHQYPQLFEPPSQLRHNSGGGEGAGQDQYGDSEDDDTPSEDDCIAYDHSTGQLILQQCRKPGLSKGLAVYAVAKYIGGLGGDYGFRPRETDDDENDSVVEDYDGELEGSCKHKEDEGTGSIFWFSLPLRLPSASGDDKNLKRPLDAAPLLHQKTEMTARSSKFEANCL
jgi:hypothetical protein